MIHHLFCPAITITTDGDGKPTLLYVDWADSYDSSLADPDVPGQPPIELERDHPTATAASAWLEATMRPAIDGLLARLTGDTLDAAIDARGQAEKLVAVAACREIARAVRAVAPTAVALLVEDSDQNDRGRLTPCSLIDADGNVLDVDVDEHLYDVGQLDEYNEEVWGPAQEREPDRRLIIDRLDQVTGG